MYALNKKVSLYYGTEDADCCPLTRLTSVLQIILLVTAALVQSLTAQAVISIFCYVQPNCVGPNQKIGGQDGIILRKQCGSVYVITAVAIGKNGCEGTFSAPKFGCNNGPINCIKG